ncbi:hypothetical protein [Variovorax sp. PBL-E5]|uniref:hypothetical protein n=1 Tax=Variovorax sp. PBL-E5 TaxID=434014 RepID=UPI001315F84D|nr:hypothetical protein [Variovorax sp. PBL-E5]VTU24835.1 hypothetical protein E5CHR_01875 [Variovorax sp. PBL-E5]
MSLADLMRKGSLRMFATATLATVATHEAASGATVAEVATVAVANSPGAKVEDDPTDLDRWCWPRSDAMNGAEIDRLVSRVELFVGRGVTLIDATALADSLVRRDREGDDRWACVECANLTNRRCATWRRAGTGGPIVPTDLATTLQRCQGFVFVDC